MASEDLRLRGVMSMLVRSAECAHCCLVAAILCLVSITSPVRAQSVPKTITDQAIAESEKTLAEFAEMNVAAIFARFDTEMRRGVTGGQFAAFVKQQAAESGPIKTASAHAVTAYRTPELLLAVDFSGTTSQGLIFCGFFAWSGADKRDFMIRRMEINYVPPRLAKKTGAPKKAAILMVEFRCPKELIKAVTGVVVN